MTFTTKIAYAAATMFATADAGPCDAEQATCMGTYQTDYIMNECVTALMTSNAGCRGNGDAGLAGGHIMCTDNGDETCSDADGTVSGGTCAYTAAGTEAEMQTACAANTNCAALMTCTCADDPTCDGAANCACDAAPAPAAASGTERVAPAVMLAFAAAMAGN